MSIWWQSDINLNAESPSFLTSLNQIKGYECIVTETGNFRTFFQSIIPPDLPVLAIKLRIFTPRALQL